MKTINFVISVILGIISLVIFFNSETDLWFMFGFVILINSFIFFLFGVLEEKDEEIKKLRNRVDRYQHILMED